MTPEALVHLQLIRREDLDQARHDRPDDPIEALKDRGLVESAEVERAERWIEDASTDARFMLALQIADRTTEMACAVEAAVLAKGAGETLGRQRRVAQASARAAQASRAANGS